jgi:hypothetical protein
MGVKLAAASGGSIELVPTNTASTFTVTVPAKTGTMAMDGPAFSYYQSVAQTLATATFTKITFTTSEFDTTGGMYASSSFTPTVAGYYQVSGGVGAATSAVTLFFYLYKNGALYKNMGGTGGTASIASGSSLVYLNGSTDYIELYAYFGVGQNTSTNLFNTYFQAAMVRGA